jgi:UrcA family protein
MVEKSFPLLRLGGLMFAAVGASLCGFVSANSPAVAQAAPASPEVTEEIIVRGPYIVRREPLAARNRYGLTNPEIISVSRAVSYADIDLSKGPGANELEKRIRDTANDVCQELNRRYPRSGIYIYVSTDCVKSATDDAMAVAKQVIAAASG